MKWMLRRIAWTPMLILSLPALSVMKRTGCINNFASLMHLVTQFSWTTVSSLHTAALFEVECSQLNWGDSLTT